MWLSSLTATEKAGRLFEYQGFNAHSKHLLAYFSSKVSSTPQYFIQKDLELFSKQELLLQQTLRDEELDWEALATDKAFPYSLDFLFKLLSISSKPLKIIFTISPSALFELFSRANFSTNRTVMEKLLSQLEEVSRTSLKDVRFTDILIPICIGI